MLGREEVNYTSWIMLVNYPAVAILGVGVFYSFYNKDIGGIHGQKFGRKWLNDGFSGNTPIFFYFLLTIFSETRTKNGGIHVFLEIRTWKPVVVFIETGGFGGVGGLRPQLHQKPPVSMNQRRFQVLIPKNTWIPPFLVRVSLKS